MQTQSPKNCSVTVAQQMQMMGRVSLFNKDLYGERFVCWAYGQQHCEESSLTSPAAFFFSVSAILI